VLERYSIDRADRCSQAAVVGWCYRASDRDNVPGAVCDILLDWLGRVPLDRYVGDRILFSVGSGRLDAKNRRGIFNRLPETANVVCLERSCLKLIANGPRIESGFGEVGGPHDDRVGICSRRILRQRIIAIQIHSLRQFPLNAAELGGSKHCDQGRLRQQVA
jgi:hypothetical protein